MYRFAVVFALLAIVAFPPAALGDPPARFPAGNIDFVDTTCGFDVAVHYVVDREIVKVFSDGTIIITGSLTATLTHGSKSIYLNVSGPGFIRTNADGTVTFYGTGRGFGPVGGTLITASGLIIVPLLPPGTGFQAGGTSTDLCLLLA
jgi:hypothetical protein